MTDQEKIELLATKVMGWEKISSPTVGTYVFRCPHPHDRHLFRDVFWNPLHNIADAWMIVNRLLESGRFEIVITVSADGAVCALIDSKNLKTYFCAEGNAAQKAICNAALKAVGVHVG